jgi:hypothetical protein
VGQVSSSRVWDIKPLNLLPEDRPQCGIQRNLKHSSTGMEPHSHVPGSMHSCLYEMQVADTVPVSHKWEAESSNGLCKRLASTLDSTTKLAPWSRVLPEK